MLRGGQVTLPVEARKALKLREGDYLDVSVTDGSVTLKPVAVIDRAEADRRLAQIFSRVAYVGSEAEPSEDEIMDIAAEEIGARRAKR